MTYAEREKKYKKNQLIINPLILFVFLALMFSFNYGNRSFILTITGFTVFAIVLVLSNYLNYSWLRKK